MMYKCNLQFGCRLECRSRCECDQHLDIRLSLQAHWSRTFLRQLVDFREYPCKEWSKRDMLFCFGTTPKSI